jgi:hypothetical protein
MNGAQALFKALIDAGLDTISRDTLIRREFLAASASAAAGVTIMLPGPWARRLASSKAKRKVIKKEPVDLPPAI